MEAYRSLMRLICRKYSKASKGVENGQLVSGSFTPNALWPLIFSRNEHCFLASLYTGYILVSLFTYQHERGLKWI